MKDCNDNGVTKATDIPYFEGDFWSSTIEDLLKELDTEEEDRRKFEELEAAKASEDGCFDDSIEPEGPTEVVRMMEIKEKVYSIYLIIDFR